jgi:flap endonuclease-1
MGIQYLNKFLKTECHQSIYNRGLKQLSGKKIVVDIGIYMFKFAADDSLKENMYLMFSVFKYYNIIPIFVFDGKPPTEKKELIEKRREAKKKAELKYEILKTKLNDCDNIVEINEIENSMDSLKKQFVYLLKSDFIFVKELINAFGYTYIDAPEEADIICAYLTIKGIVWGCLSEDMDMFIYGCPIIIRYFSLLNHSCVIYNLSGILNELRLTQYELKQIGILSGTDYNRNEKKINLHIILKYFKKYKKKKISMDFYDWLIVNTDFIDNIDLLNKINDMFNVSNKEELKIYDKQKIISGCHDKEKISNLLKDDGFIFL